MGKSHLTPLRLDIRLCMRKNNGMKIKGSYTVLLFALSLILSSCAPVLSRNIMREGDRQVSFSELRQHPDQYKGQLYIFGGVIVQTKFTESGSQIEAMEVPVDRYGYFVDRGRSEGRFLALLPRDREELDPLVYRRGRRVTLAAAFVGMRSGKIDEMEYSYPVFDIQQIYLWPRERTYYYYPSYYYDPWFYPYPYYYWAPWWGGYYYYGGRQPAPAQPAPGQSPGYRRPPPASEPSAPPPQRRTAPQR